MVGGAALTGLNVAPANANTPPTHEITISAEAASTTHAKTVELAADQAPTGTNAGIDPATTDPNGVPYSPSHPIQNSDPRPGSTLPDYNNAPLPDSCRTYGDYKLAQATANLILELSNYVTFPGGHGYYGYVKNAIDELVDALKANHNIKCAFDFANQKFNADVSGYVYGMNTSEKQVKKIKSHIMVVLNAVAAQLANGQKVTAGGLSNILKNATKPNAKTPPNPSGSFHIKEDGEYNYNHNVKSIKPGQKVAAQLSKKFVKKALKNEEKYDETFYVKIVFYDKNGKVIDTDDNNKITRADLKNKKRRVFGSAPKGAASAALVARGEQKGHNTSTNKGSKIKVKSKTKSGELVDFDPYKYNKAVIAPTADGTWSEVLAVIPIENDAEKAEPDQHFNAGTVPEMDWKGNEAYTRGTDDVIVAMGAGALENVQTAPPHKLTLTQNDFRKAA
ncbi:MAG: hypothetical protein LBM73_03205 [Candidatus Nomurabacteria bacterium]|nr:hypothetical protein [Candidatus Nomurabacteria bacterium]